MNNPESVSNKVIVVDGAEYVLSSGGRYVPVNSNEKQNTLQTTRTVAKPNRTARAITNGVIFSTFFLSATSITSGVVQNIPDAMSVVLGRGTPYELVQTIAEDSIEQLRDIGRIASQVPEELFQAIDSRNGRSGNGRN